MPRPFLAAALALSLSLAACGATSTATTAAPPATTSPPPTTAAVPAATTSTTTPASTTTLSDDVDPAVAAALRETIDELAEVTEEIRGLEFLREPVVTIVSEAELAERIAALISEELDPDETARDEQVYKLLGILEPDTDLAEMFIELYSEQVAGYYDGDTEEMVVPATDEGFTPLQQMTVVHELTHALTDQHFGFDDLFEALDDQELYEEAAALRALTEGDATLTEALFFNTVLTAAEQAQVFEAYDDIDQSVLEATPSFITDLLTFPYNDGATFAIQLWQRGGFEAIDAAYGDPPVTTEQIIVLGLYEAGEVGVDVTLPDMAIDGYENAEESVWGHAALAALFGQSLGPSTDAAARGWGGDRYRVLWNGEQAVFVLSWVGDSAEDADEIESAFLDLTTEQVRVGAYTFVGRDGDAVVFIAADDAAAGEAAKAAFPAFGG